MTPSLIDLPRRCRLEVKGPEAKTFLNGIVTCDVKKLKNSWVYALHLTHRGKIVFDFFLQELNGVYVIDVDVDLKESLFQTFQKYIVFQQAHLVDVSDDWRAIAVIGETLKIPADAEMIVFDKPLWGHSAREIWGSPDRIAALKKTLEVPEISKIEQEVLRIESSTPKFGIDFGTETIPQEANLYNALSFDKGCYVGQEIVARLEHRGHVSKQLVLLATESLLKRGSKILAAEDQKEIGEVTSSVVSPKYNAPIALAYLKYAWLQKPLHHAHRL